MTTALLEPFESFNYWSTNAPPWSIVPGRTGNCAQATTGATNTYRIPSTLESATITLGFAVSLSSLAANRQVISLFSDSDTTQHITVVVNTDGSVGVRRGAINGTVLGTTVTGLVVINTFVYIELQVVMSDTVGVVNLNVDGTSRLTLTSQDTKNAGTKTVFDALRITGTLSLTVSYDDMYVAMGGGESFRGPQSIASTTTALNARQSARVAVRDRGEESRNARQSVRVAIGPAPLGIFVNVWNGSAFVSAPVKVWDGTAFVNPVAVKTWTGSAFV